MFIDRRADAVRLVKDNLELCGLSDRASVRCGDAMSYLRSGEKFDLIFLDPPYAAGLLGPALEEIARFDICREHGIIVAESALETALPALAPPYTLYREYAYRQDQADGVPSRRKRGNDIKRRFIPAASTRSRSGIWTSSAARRCASIRCACA